MSLAFATPLALRFLSDVGLTSSGDFISAAISPGCLSNPLFAPVGIVMCEGLCAAGWGASATASSSFPGVLELPNILFSSPPELEKLLRLLPARLTDFKVTCDSARVLQRDTTWGG